MHLRLSQKIAWKTILICPSTAYETDTEENQNPNDKENNDPETADDDQYDDQEDASKVDNFDDETENRIHETPSENDKKTLSDD